MALKELTQGLLARLRGASPRGDALPEPLDALWLLDGSLVERLSLFGDSASARDVLLERIRASDKAAINSGDEDLPAYPTVVRVGAVAVVCIAGVLAKGSRYYGVCSSLARDCISGLAADESAESILLYVDSPGGTVRGTGDLAAAIAEAAQKKNVVAYIEDLGASAAYWIASQASKVYANPTALVGSIGTFSVVYDMSAMAEQLGFKVHVMRAGEYKGAGTPGTAVTEEQIAEWQRVVDSINEHFIAGVAAGRHMSADAVRAIADGRVHVGKEAVALGLIDGVQTLEATIQSLQRPAAAPGRNPNRSRTTMASFQEIKAACPGADADFLVAQMSADASVDQARENWMTEQSKRLAAKDAELAKLKDDQHKQAAADAEAAKAKAVADAEAAKAKAAAEAEAAKLAGAPPGVKPIAQGKAAPVSGAEDPAVAFEAKVEEKVKAGKPRHLAHQLVARENPELRRAMVVAANAEKGRKVDPDSLAIVR